ncbi:MULTISPECIES: LysM peptidoglycan-binding domain-containing protein [Stenotrophomonas]|uniref:Peptidoglycan-binding protein LysM n=1 Tax=Stenotrophomonas nitritireducens TaxID=83617 RepID=A0ABR5NMN2_9GAMM|nr:MULTISPECIES: LysM peptidoglycan-binding domain-containing protein [Stenotrophomonas]KQN97378.1 peptidoglycan-binding protein LysM [Stenotrophomonas sp. Leaf70]KRG59383.1 peptidoglycan-binding protein LysM [Stenotrophomonas nitritireducens]MBN8792849.1 LysM peptidoglycan-binding domain-containing protein [Stenotrophomonas nitritireducens]MBN8796442.1 LysM peptidoglycan-binding domain-containing protein [Stenotrophomonas nitritireducens]
MSSDNKANFSGVTGTVTSTEQIVPKADFSGVTGTVTSTEEIVGEQQYTVQKGDSLSRIAKNLLGDANAWKRIFEANRDVLDNPDKIFPGQVLKVPPREG